MPKFTTTDYAQALYDAVHESKNHEVVLGNFVKILAQNGDLGKYEEIEKEYKLIEMKAKGIKEVEVTMAREMSVNKAIIDELNSVIGRSSGTDVKKKLDESIIGGVVVRVDDTLIDASVKTQLNNLNQELKS